MITISIVNSGTTTSLVPEGDVTVGSNGFRTSYVVDKDAGKVRQDCSVDDGWVEKFYADTRDAIENHVATTLENAGLPYNVDFTLPQYESTDGYYVSRINGVAGMQGCFAVTAGPNFRWAPKSSGLSVFDLSRPCVDCLDYMRIAGYVTRIEETLSSIARSVSGVPDDVQSNPAVYGLFKQYQALRELWNYLVVRNTVVFNVENQGNRLFLKARFTNPSGDSVTVGPLTAGFSSCPYNGLFHKAWSTDSSGNGLDWTTSSSKLQPMSTGSWIVSPPSTVTIPAGGYIEVTVAFIVFGTALASLTPSIARDMAPWASADKRPVIANGKVTSAGWLSWERPHFNPSSYSSGTVPAGLPPTGDNCLLKRSPGTVSSSWMTNGSILSTRPALHIDLRCTADKLQASFDTDFDLSVYPETADPNGTFGVSGSGATATVNWTPTGGSATNILSVAMTDRHFHQGDRISLDVPEGWCAPVNATHVKASCIWDIPVNSCIVDPSRAGGMKWCWIRREPLSRTLPVRSGDADYDVEKTRNIEVE